MAKHVVQYEIKVGAKDHSIDPMEFKLSRVQARRQLNLGSWREVYREVGFRILYRERGASYATLRVSLATA